MGWELNAPCSFESELLVPNQQINEDDESFAELGFQELMPKRFQEDPIRDVLSCKVDGGKMASPTIATPLNMFSGEDESISKQSSSILESNSKESSFIDLKLGRFTDHRDAQNSNSFKEVPLPTLSSAKSRAPKKRVQAASFNSLTPFCQVHGCSKDLSSSKGYHKRHRVCEDHSKTPKVIVNGIEQRFCQQCSRFQLLAEFDDGKRSCRKRLAGHNERRRKFQVGISGRTGRLRQSYNGFLVLKQEATGKQLNPICSKWMHPW